MSRYLSVAIALVATLHTAPLLAAPWFGPGALVSPPGFTAITNGSPPKSDADTNFDAYPNNQYWPQSVAASMNSTETARGVWANIWAYNYTEGKSLKSDPNVVPRSACALRFSDLHHAKAWLAEVAESVGYGPYDAHYGYLTMLHRFGFADAQIYTYDAFVAAAPYICTYANGDKRGALVAPVDTAVLPDGNLYQLPAAMPKLGVVAQYYPADGRTPAYTTQMMQEFAQLVHSKGYLATLESNRIDDGSATGLDTGFAEFGQPGWNVDAVAALVDGWYIGTPAGSTPQSGLATELAAFGAPPYHRLGLSIDMANDQPADVAAAYQDALTLGLMGFFFWPNDTVLGSADPCNRQNEELAAGTGNASGCH